jgi:hypothetical protein
MFDLSGRLNSPGASWGYRNSVMRFCLKDVTPECFYRGSTPDPHGFPLKACGNDGLGIDNLLGAASCGELIHRD